MPRAGGRRRAPDRLRAHRGGERGRWHRGPDVGRAGSVSVPAVALRRGGGRHRRREPPRHPRVRQALRGADLPLHREPRGADRRTAGPVRCSTFCRRLPISAHPPGLEGVGLFLLLRAFASGCTALTGVEAVSDGVPAFKPPEAHNARIVLTWLGLILIVALPRHHVPGVRLRHRAAPGGDRGLAARAARVRRRHDVLRDPGGHDADPPAGRQHVLRRLSAAARSSSRATASFRASSRRRATGSCSPTAS